MRRCQFLIDPRQTYFDEKGMLKRRDRQMTLVEEWENGTEKLEGE